ncbi:unnamed protein product [Lactuca saligna]|uniref:Uncharacterized protein n=1 Tax=Lactuca saligna TaxID=75948 RepID=A0AA35US20_LACSI|nr:unnamed protein product [Lactuca saligna]
MEGAHQGILFYQNVVPHRVVDEDPVVEAAAGVRPEEHVDTDYGFEEPDEIIEEDGDVNEAPGEPHPSEVLSNPPMIPETDIDYIRSLEEEITNLKRHLFAAEARAVQAEQREDVITQEVNKMAELLIRQLDD